MPIKEIPKSSALKKLEEMLSGLIDEGAHRLESYSIPSAHQNRRSIFALATYAEVSELAEGALLLGSNLKPDPSHIIVRSMQEGYFNLAYVLQPPDNVRLVELLYRGAARDRNNLKDVKRYLKKHPSEQHKRMLDQFNDRDTVLLLNTMISGSKKELIDARGRKFVDRDELSLWARVKEYDATSKSIGKETHHTLDYLALYSHFCRFAHLGTSVIAGKMEKEDTSFTLTPDNPVPKCEQALLSAFSYLADTLVLTLKQIGADWEDLLEDSKGLAEEIELN